ncbi:hypothetical protein C0991_007881 [Blastosporella zonata]|nr:hypothetical protein C0991_007881 [Blastosporella zonata]
MGVSLDQARDFVQEAQERIDIRKSKRRQISTPTPEPVPDAPVPADQAVGDCSQTLQVDERQEDSDNRGWEELQTSFAFANQHSELPNLMDRLVELFDDGRDRKHHSGIPDSVLAAAPYLADKVNVTPDDPHVEKTKELRRVFSSERVLDALLNFARSQYVKDPVLQGIWKLIILDQFVDFPKLYATFAPSYNHNDNPRDFGHDFVLIKKDQVNQRRSIVDQSGWTRCFDAWAEGVILFYPHRQRELRVYREEVIDIFQRGIHSISTTLNFDIDARSHYANQPFRLDDMVRLQKMYTDQVIKSNQASKQTTSFALSSIPKRKAIPICQNWNLGTCNDEDCPQRHGLCNKCRENH